MFGFKSMSSACANLCDIAMVHMMRKRRTKYASNPQPSLAEQFDLLAARADHSRLLPTRPCSGFATELLLHRKCRDQCNGPDLRPLTSSRCPRRSPSAKALVKEIKKGSHPYVGKPPMQIESMDRLFFVVLVILEQWD
jgi:hypothetical protein